MILRILTCSNKTGNRFQRQGDANQNERMVIFKEKDKRG